MLHIGDHVGVKARQGIGSVIELSTNGFRVEFVTGVRTPETYHFVYSDLGTYAASVVWLYECPHTSAAPQIPDYVPALIDRLSYNTGVMESTLELIWRQATRASNPERRINPHDERIAWSIIVDEIERTAGMLRGEFNSSGDAVTPYLAAAIYRNRK